MMQRNNHPQTSRLATSTDAPGALLRCLPLIAALFLVVLLITVQPGAGTGFA